MTTNNRWAFRYNSVQAVRGEQGLGPWPVAGVLSREQSRSRPFQEDWVPNGLEAGLELGDLKMGAKSASALSVWLDSSRKRCVVVCVSVRIGGLILGRL